MRQVHIFYKDQLATIIKNNIFALNYKYLQNEAT